jgi:hypothetical protein
MQETEILNLWKTYNKKLEENLIINKKKCGRYYPYKSQVISNIHETTKVFYYPGWYYVGCFC